MTSGGEGRGGGRDSRSRGPRNKKEPTRPHRTGVPGPWGYRGRTGTTDGQVDPFRLGRPEGRQTESYPEIPGRGREGSDTPRPESCTQCLGGGWVAHTSLSPGPREESGRTGESGPETSDPGLVNMVTGGGVGHPRFR